MEGYQGYNNDYYYEGFLYYYYPEQAYSGHGQQGHHTQYLRGYVVPEWQEQNTRILESGGDSSGNQYPQPSHQPTMEGVPLPPGIPGLGGSTDPLEAVLGPFPCARLRRLPFDATLEDILILFQGLVVIDVVLVGQGEAFVIFANPMDYQMALQRDRQTIGKSFVEISPGSRSDYYSAIAAQQWQEQKGGPQGRSSYDRQAGDDHRRDVGDNRSDSASWGAGLHSLSRPGMGAGMSGGMGGGPSDRLGGRDDGLRRTPLGLPGMGPPRTTFGPPRASGAMVKRTGGGIQVGEHTGFLRMRGLPFSANKEDIYRFFEPYNPVAESIVLTYRSDGRATGEAYVGFETPDDSKRAMELHRKSMGTRYIELFLSNRDEHGRALARFGDR
ncbi:RNA recognition motif containing protein [Nitzschia inconspicua]|uniref:RNA recognition motif containing protein n=1 Tax=Nitzschia inconspicua TaxID=303405 RepID=A0A9K3LHJ4_9STRA|nr:RNA recognition motif containing protein [Nitzschia inconspicua]KAG7361021.1 RNA recognition motif containing protein [Nitzschia inconspicua]